MTEPEPPYWRYLPSKRPNVRHALDRPGDAAALCGVGVMSIYWRGTGSQEEYETVAALPKCRGCQRVLGQRR